MNLPMLSDITKQISRNYGVLIEDGEDAGVAFRATFIIDGAGILRHKSISDLPVGRNVDETLRLVKAFQHTDIHGEVCPASW
jgi:alkyl hydroperoxide reductase subunit AhpC